MKKIRSREQLVEAVQAGNKLKYLFFWGHQKSDSLTKTCFSQWYEAPFEIEDVTYLTAEHYMMAEKARLFGDNKMLDKILNCSHPKEAKAYGRKVSNFCPDEWNEKCFEIVVAGNVAKFSQNPAMGEFLLGTNSRVLVEASPRDRVWGIGMSANNELVEQPQRWRGKNLLGFALMEVRERIAE